MNFPWQKKSRRYCLTEVITGLAWSLDLGYVLKLQSILLYYEKRSL